MPIRLFSDDQDEFPLPALFPYLLFPLPLSFVFKHVLPFVPLSPFFAVLALVIFPA